MELVLDDVVRVLKGLVLSGQGIGGMKELIDSILHGQSSARTLNLVTAPTTNDFSRVQTPQNNNSPVTCTALLLHPSRQHGGKAVRLSRYLSSLSFF